MPASISPALQIAAAPATAAGGRGPAGRMIAGRLDLRISDTERMEVADELGRHYSEGRLDEAEFTCRLDRVMAAATYQGLAGVLEDLPQPSSPAFAGPARRVPPRLRPACHQRSGAGQLAVLALLAIVLVLVSHAVNWVLGPVPWVGLLCLLAVIVMRRRNRG
jgi:hypothetical protein